MEKRKWTDQEINEYRKTHESFFYFNKEDSNIFVPKVAGFGKTVNWANPVSWTIVLALIAFVVYNIFQK